ncbi:uncharacterized protein L203_101918 [Cryptococcus depauperatus CBS 7841]|uniref:Phosphotyrosine protein phosphatase I domain-containing protein n=1 Tax=Cryptococcus depauperatus CBS 7841 TaxID=1295531 RepID=A0AAJ8M0L7_9TREE
MAEAVLKHQISLRPKTFSSRFEITVDSAGTGAYHEGEPPDSRTVAVCRKHQVPVDGFARAVNKLDFQAYDFILAMDQHNLETLLHRKPSSSKSRIVMFGSFDPSLPTSALGSHKTKARAIEDPYYGGRDGFEKSFESCVLFGNGFLDWLESGQR